MAVMEKISNRDVAKVPTPQSGNVIERVTQILGYDIGETQAIESDGELYGRILARLGNGETVSASNVFGSTAE